jgi:hypothetical protein
MMDSPEPPYSPTSGHWRIEQWNRLKATAHARQLKEASSLAPKGRRECAQAAFASFGAPSVGVVHALEYGRDVASCVVGVLTLG